MEGSTFPLIIIRRTAGMLWNSLTIDVVLRKGMEYVKEVDPIRRNEVVNDGRPPDDHPAARQLPECQ
jgi:hypothetical protein